MSDRSSKVNLENTLEEVINPATEDKQDDIIDNQTNGDQLVKIYDSLGNYANMTTLGQLKIVESYRLSGGVFNDSVLDSNFYTGITDNGGTTTVANMEAQVQTGALSDSYAGIYANSIARYIGTNQNYFRSVHRCGGGDNVIARYGLCDILPLTDGFYFQTEDGILSVIVNKGGVETKINSGSFNGNGSGSGGTYVFDLNYHTLEIIYTSRRVSFIIDTIPLHTIFATTEPLINNRHLRPFFDNKTTAINSGSSCYSLSLTVSKYGMQTSQAKTYFQQGQTAGVLLKVGPGALHLLNISGVVNNSVITLYNGLDTGGTVIWASGTMGAQTQPFGIDLDGAGGTQFSDGLYLTITGAASNCFVKYE